MYRYPGTLVHRCRDRQGVIDVVDSGNIRTLHFGTRATQSSMDLLDPVRLVLDYLRGMLAALLFCERPRALLMIGLGGGSLVRFALDRLPDIRVDVVECRQRVIDVAFEFFRLPKDQRLRVHLGDGAELVREGSAGLGESEYDLILVDAYDHARMSESVASPEFFRACRERLRAGGILSMNVWSDLRRPYRQTVAALRDSFGDQVLLLPVTRRGNLIGLGFNASLEPKMLAVPRRRVHALEREYGLELHHFLRRLRVHNTPLLARWKGNWIGLGRSPWL
jgi:spermidine synthase